MIERLLALYRLIPHWAMARIVPVSLEGDEVYLCLHRVGTPTAKLDAVAAMSILPIRLDELFRLLGCAGPGPSPARVVASFDDGYFDAVEYVLSRHEVFPNVEWMFFVCPSKVLLRSGFRWDAEDPVAEEARPRRVAEENQRESLRGGADAPSHRLLATADELREIARLPRVTVGNHTNCHFALSEMSLSECQLEVEESRRDFESMFEPTEHFAFPYGVPGKHFGREHEELLAAEGYRYLYTTKPRTVQREAGAASQLVHRFGVFGTWPVEKTAMFIALIGMREKFRRFRPTDNEKSS